MRLEGRSVEQPDRQSADRDDAEKDEHEGDVRLPLGIVLSEAVHLPGNPRSCGAEGDRTPDLMSAIHETDSGEITQKTLAKNEMRVAAQSL